MGNVGFVNLLTFSFIVLSFDLYYMYVRKSISLSLTDKIVEFGV